MSYHPGHDTECNLLVLFVSEILRHPPWILGLCFVARNDNETGI